MSITFDIRRTGLLIRLAARADAKAVRMLLPHAPDEAERIVAVDRDHELVIGAATATPAMRKGPLPGPGVAVHVIEPCRRCGVGATLVAELMSRAVARGAQALYAMRRVVLDSPEMRGWQSLGFSVCETVEEHEIGMTDVEARLGPLVDRMSQQRRIPGSARIVPLYAVDPTAVVDLHLRHMGGDRETLLRRVTGKARDAFHPRYSLVLTLGGAAIGCLLGRRHSQDVFVVDAVAVDEALRNGWANLWLKLEAARRVRPLGATRIRFTSFERYVDTRRFAEKLGGTTIRRLTLMHRRIG